jgi:Zinc knuckle
VLDNYHEWERQDPLLDTRGLLTYGNGVKKMIDHYTTDEQEELRVVGNRSWKKLNCGMQGHKASDCTVKKQRMNTANGNKGENMKNNCFNCGKPGHYSKNCPEKSSNSG